jgi:putative ABC transport system permease protein
MFDYSMFQYYFRLGLRSLRRSPALTALIVLTLAVGVAASVSTLTILHMMSGDPIPQKSDRLFVPVIDAAPLDQYVVGEKPDRQISYPDATNFLRSKQGVRRTALYGVSVPIESTRKDIAPFEAQGAAPTRDFFAMFEVPFLFGQAWSEADDASGADVVVLSRQLSEKLFGTTNPVGQRLTMMTVPYLVVGVADKWQPEPHYYNLANGNSFGNRDQYWLPLASAIRNEAGLNGGMSCPSNPAPGYKGIMASDCTWLQFWFETASASDRASLQSYLDAYADDQRKLGRMPRKAKNSLYNVMEWLDYLGVVGKDSTVSAWLAFAFLVLCLVNTIGLLLAKFSARATEVGVRRALGASKAAIFRQFLVETTVIGLAGGLLGLLLAFGALGLIGMQSRELQAVAHMDLLMLAVTFTLSVLAALLAGLLPTWRACQVTPAMQLKSQ